MTSKPEPPLMSSRPPMPVAVLATHRAGPAFAIHAPAGAGYHSVTGAATNRVAQGTAKDDVAHAVGAAGDVVNAADAFIDAEDVAVAANQVHLAAVAQDDLAAGRRVDRVVVGAAEDHVSAGAALDVVPAAHPGSRADDVQHVARIAIDVAAVAQDHVVAGAAADDVALGAAEDDVAGAVGAAGDGVNA